MEFPASQGSSGGKNSLRLTAFRNASSNGFSPQTMSGANERMYTDAARTARNIASTRATYRQPERRKPASSLLRRPATASESPAIRKRTKKTEPRLLGNRPATEPAHRP